MDIDRYIARNSATWLRLEQLVAGADGKAKNLSADEVDELIQLYQRTSAHLSHVRAQHDDRGVINQLSTLLTSARQVIYGKRSSGLAAANTFFTLQLPGALWTIRKYILLTTSLFVVTALISGVFLYNRSDALAVSVPPELQDALVASEFEDYYSSEEAGVFAAKVQVNNIFVSFMAFGGGAAAGVIPVWMIFNEGTRMGTMAAVMHRGDAGSKFWGLILPHGLLELTAIFVAAAAGLYMGWSLISPGRRSRGAAFVEAANTAVTVAMGLVLCFIIAGFIEAFVTPSGLPTAARVAIGVFAELLFLGYIAARGPTAVSLGYDGRMFGTRPSWAREGDRLDSWVSQSA